MEKQEHTFEELLEAALIESGFEYIPFKQGGHIFGRFPDSNVYHLKGVIKQGEKELVFCTPNEPTGAVPEDARHYANKLLIDHLLQLGVKYFGPGKTTSMHAGLMASQQGAIVNQDSLQFTLTPRDVRETKEKPLILANMKLHRLYEFALG